MSCHRFGFEEFSIDRLDKLSPFFVRIDCDNPVVRYPVLPEEVQETDGGALGK